MVEMGVDKNFSVIVNFHRFKVVAKYKIILLQFFIHFIECLKALLLTLNLNILVLNNFTRRLTYSMLIYKRTARSFKLFIFLTQVKNISI